MAQATSVESHQEKIAGASGLNLFVRSWRPAGKARGIVVLCHGFNSHSGYYVSTAEQLAARGLTVFALDLRGRGQSDGERFFVEKMEDYVNDVATVVALAKSREPGLPLYLLGHSAGGVTACLYALDYQPELAGLICESFAFQVPAPGFALAAIKGLSHIAPHAHVLRLHNKDFSRDPKAVATMDADPLIAHEVQPSQTVAAMVRGDDRLKANLALITIPVLILHGTADKATKPSGSQFFYDNAGSKDRTLKLYDGHFHDLLNDLGKEQVLADIQGWLDGRLPKA